MPDGLAAWEARSGRSPRTPRPARGTTRRPTTPHAWRPSIGGPGPRPAATMTEERVARAERELAALGEREARLSAERDALRGELAAAAAAEVERARGADRPARRRRRRRTRLVRGRTRRVGRPGAPADGRRSTAGRRPRASSRPASGSIRCARACSSSSPAWAGSGSRASGSTTTPVTSDRLGRRRRRRTEADRRRRRRLRRGHRRPGGALVAVAGRWAAEPPTVRPALARPARAAAPPLPRARRGQPVRRRRVRRAQDPARDPRGAGHRPAVRDRQDPRAHRRARHDDRRPVPDDVRCPRDARSSGASNSSSAAGSPGCR